MPVAYCYAEFEIEKSGYEFYKTKFGEFEQYRTEHCYACEKVLFKPIITLKIRKENGNPIQHWKTKTTANGRLPSLGA